MSTQSEGVSALTLKSPEQRHKEQIKKYVDEYAALTQESDRIKERVEWLKGYFETLAAEELRDTKLLSASFWGNQNSRVTVTNTATVKPVSLTMVKSLLGSLSGDFIKTESVDKLSEPCKRFFAMVVQGQYTEGSLEETVREITADAKIQETLRKKLKGRFEKDKAALIKLAGLPEQEAGDWAYLAAEVLNWEWLTQILQAAQWTGGTQAAIDTIRAAVIVEEGLKVGIDCEN